VIDTNLTSMFTDHQGGSAADEAAERWAHYPDGVDRGCQARRDRRMPYQISKAGVALLAKQSALELARYNILVNAILPGPFSRS